MPFLVVGNEVLHAPSQAHHVHRSKSSNNIFSHVIMVSYSSVGIYRSTMFCLLRMVSTEMATETRIQYKYSIDTQYYSKIKQNLNTNDRDSRWCWTENLITWIGSRSCWKTGGWIRARGAIVFVFVRVICGRGDEGAQWL